MPQPHQRYHETREETAECSVASCSANDDVAGHPCCSVGRSDAMSVVAAPCTSTTSSSGRRSTDEDGVLSDGPPAMDVHELELEAYRSTVRALHASGPLTWEQESLLTNLRLSLNISNEEHLLQLRRLLSS